MRRALWVVLAVLPGIACGNGKMADGSDAPVASDTADVAGADATTDADASAVGQACACKPDQFCKDGQCLPRPSEAAAQKARKSCQFGKGTLAAESVGSEHPVGNDIPIDTFVLVMMENRSFDHYFGAGPQFGIAVDGHPKNASNPNDKGEAVPVYHEVTGCIHDVAHSWTASHKQWNGGNNDGFWLTNHSPAADGARALGYFDGSDLQFYYGLAKAFGISDRHHCSLLGPTWVNRMYYVAGTSWGLIRNELPSKAEMAGRQHAHILAQLTKAGVDWRIYAQPLTVFLLFGDWFGEGDNAARLRGIDEYFADAKAGKLPPVSFVEPDYAASGAARQDEHPPGTPWQGEQFVHSVVTALMASPQWPRAAYIQTYDEHGGFYDHVPPPEACEPDEHQPKLEPKDSPGKFDRLGFRVPFLVASPWSKPGYVSHVTTDNTSPMRLVQARFNLPALTRRDANAWPLYDFFDFSKPQMLVPPKLPEPKPMAAEIAACKKKFP